jgi:hypothetical protein
MVLHEQTGPYLCQLQISLPMCHQAHYAGKAAHKKLQNGLFDKDVCLRPSLHHLLHMADWGRRENVVFPALTWILAIHEIGRDKRKESLDYHP